MDPSQISCDESESSLKYFSSAYDLFPSARKSENCHFLLPRFFFLISPAFLLYFRFILLQIIMFLFKMTNFWGEKKKELKKLYIKKKSSSVATRKLKCSSSAWLGTFIARLSLSWKIQTRTHHY